MGYSPQAAPCNAHLTIRSGVFESLAHLVPPDSWDDLKEEVLDELGGHVASVTMSVHKKPDAPDLKATLQPLENTRVRKVVLTGLRLGAVIHVDCPPLLQLQQLVLTHCELQFVHAGNFLQTPGLIDLDLSHNYLEKIPAGIENMTKLTHLDVSWNRLRTPVNVSNMHSLKSLNISGAVVWERQINNSLIQMLQLRGMNLTHVDLSLCSLQRLDNDSSLRLQTYLDYVNLSMNHLQSIPSTFFSPFEHIRVVDLSGNKLTTTDLQLELSSSNWLHLLDLSNNSLQAPGRVLASGKLETLDLSWNLISRWTSDQLFDSGRCVVQTANLSHNAITSVFPEMEASLEPLKSVDLGGNAINCDNCFALNPLQAWLRHVEGKVEVRDLGRRGLRCGSHLVADVHADQEPCTTSLVVAIGVPFTAVAALLGILSSMGYKYRFEISYLIAHLKLKTRRFDERHEGVGPYSYDAFIVYSNQDECWVEEQLCRTLEDGPDRYALCLYGRDLPVGSGIIEGVAASMKTSRYTVVLLSRAFIANEWCRWGLEMANYKLFLERREFLILIGLEEVQLTEVPPHLRYLVDSRTFLHWSIDGSAVFWRNLKEALGSSNHERELGEGQA